MTNDGLITFAALQYPNQNSRYYASPTGTNSFDSFFDSNCKKPVINVAWAPPTENSLMNVFQGFAKITSLSNTVVLSNYNTYRISGGNTGSCILSGTFTGTAYSDSSFSDVNPSFSIVPPIITKVQP